ncbi:phosphate ABC transporter substrate-binding protein PstS [Candidatus Cryosericum septentrionale]|jgi:phosphate transport system substrate-binding protein|uniref:Phosphate-binding protein n=1 Tax=Candidatus Cryosericum septentrionale TaxID=2290913 RepID=A0A398DT73_9BACT|nr:phosphate ABC transporter substrate-binding protein PstS [Candidatus Cryosericum septentrionale]RIE17343.1 phosphate ABC transporter substrate-binding protein PstS [Candidatus Cryosericum septentrionale]
MKNKRHVSILLTLLAIVALVASGCSPQGGSTTVKELSGAGATFPYPLYSKMFDTYASATGVRVNYNSIGSGGGIKALTDKTVDFGASDAFLTDQEEAAMGAPVLHIPTCIGAVVLSYNLDSTPALKLDGTVLAGIFLGKVVKWNDPVISALNPGVSLPDLAITVVHRSDGSGTTSIFTSYLAAISPTWKSTVGAGKSVSWPTGVGGKGNDGVAGMISQTKGSIGYIELVYAVQSGMPFASLKNASGSFVAPSLASSAAAAAVSLPNDLRVVIVNSPGTDAYPISAFTWILVYKEQKYASRTLAQAQALKKLLAWVLIDGQSVNEGMSYAKLPAPAVTKALALVDSMTYGGTAIP